MVVVKGYYSVTNVVLQRYVLGPWLLVIYIYINDLDVNIDGSISKFADTKITGITEYISDCQSIQRDIDQPVMGREMAEGD